MPKKIIATGVLPSHDGESRAQRWRSVRFGLRQTGVQVRDRGTVRKVDGKERRSKELGQSRRQANANLHCLPYLPIPNAHAVYHEIWYQSWFCSIRTPVSSTSTGSVNGLPFTSSWCMKAGADKCPRCYSRSDLEPRQI